MLHEIADFGAPPAPPSPPPSDASGSRRPARGWRSAIARLEGAYSPHTIRSYVSDFAAFADWCRKKRLSPLPALPRTVSDYIDAVAPNLKPATLKRRVSAIRKLHRLTNQ